MGNVVFLGVEGSGKSVLTSSFVSAFKKHTSDGWFLQPISEDSFRFVEQLRDGVHPDATATCRCLEWRILWNDKLVREFCVLDYPGEVYRLAFLDVNGVDDPALFQKRQKEYDREIEAFLSHLKGADTVFVLFNLDDAVDLDKNERNLDAVWVTDTCLNFLKKIPSNPRVIFLLTQIDRYCDLKTGSVSVNDLLRERLPLIWHNHRSVDCLAVSALVSHDAFCGIDTLIRHWLVDTPIIRQTYESVITDDDRLRSEINSLTSHPLKGTLKVLDALNTYERFLNQLPWFVDVFTMTHDKKLISVAEVKKLRYVCSIIGPNPIDPSSEAELRTTLKRLYECCRGLNGLAEMIYKCTYKTARGIIDKIDQERDAEAKLRKYEEEKRKRRRALFKVFCSKSGMLSIIGIGAYIVSVEWVSRCFDTSAHGTELQRQDEGGTSHEAETVQYGTKEESHEDGMAQNPDPPPRNSDMKELGNDGRNNGNDGENNLETEYACSCTFRAYVNGKEVDAKFKTDDGKVYDLPITLKCNNAHGRISGGVVSAIVNGWLYQADIEDIAMNSRSDIRVRVELDYVKKVE